VPNGLTVAPDEPHPRAGSGPLVTKGAFQAPLEEPIVTSGNRRPADRPLARALPRSFGAIRTPNGPGKVPIVPNGDP